MFAGGVPGRWRFVGFLALAGLLTLVTLLLLGIVSPPFHVNRGAQQAQEWQKPQMGPSEPCDCVWRIGCPRFRWQLNSTSPQFRCGYEEMNDSLVEECLRLRHQRRGRRLRLRVLGHVREAFLVDYVRHRLGATPNSETCRLVRAGPEVKVFGSENEQHNRVLALHDGDTCLMVYDTDHVRLEYKLLDRLGDDVFRYVASLKQECVSEGCDGDIVIISGGVGELLNSTLLESFAGVRRFQQHFKRLLPLLIDLVTSHRLEVVWKVHEPVTDELIEDTSMVRNDLLQEYNALIMEQAIRSPVRVWTSHMIMKLRHIENCAGLADDDPQLNADPWRCEDQWVAGDHCHSDYFDAIFNKVCNKVVSMPQNPCCSA